MTRLKKQRWVWRRPVLQGLLYVFRNLNTIEFPNSIFGLYLSWTYKLKNPHAKSHEKIEITYITLTCRKVFDNVVDDLNTQPYELFVEQFPRRTLIVSNTILRATAVVLAHKLND